MKADGHFEQPLQQVQHLPTLPGSYVLHLYRPVTAEIRVGRLGRAVFPAGHYYYAGSAHGPGGLRARLRRHILGSPKLHWHIDALQPAQYLHQIWVWEHGSASAAASSKSHHSECHISECHISECHLVLRLSTAPGIIHPMPGYGASDCRRQCASHLLFSPSAILFASLPPDRNISKT